MHIGYNLKKIRELKNLSREQVADHLDISVRTYSKIESGILQPSNFRLIKLANVFEIDINVIMSFDVDETLNLISHKAGKMNSIDIGDQLSEISKKLDRLAQIIEKDKSP